jgi:hypothetical protein
MKEMYERNEKLHDVHQKPYRMHVGREKQELRFWRGRRLMSGGEE